MLRSLLFCNDTQNVVAGMTIELVPDYYEEGFIPNGGWTSGLIVPTVTGGSAPYTYLWARVGGSGALSLAYAPSTKDMAINGSGTNQRYLSYFSCKATDSTGQTATAFVTFALGFNVSAYPEGSEPK